MIARVNALTAVLAVCAFSNASFAETFHGVERPRQLKCGVRSTAFAKAVVAANGSLTGSNANAFVASAFPLSLQENQLAGRLLNLKLACTTRQATWHVQPGQQFFGTRLACKSSEFSLCELWNFGYAMEPVVLIYIDGDRVANRYVEWSFQRYAIARFLARHATKPPPA